MRNNTKKITVIIALTSILVSGSLFATDIVKNAVANIMAAIVLNETTELNFGSIPIDNGICTMASGGGLSGTNGCSGTATPGAFSVTGEPSTLVNLSAVAGAAVGGVSYIPVIDQGASITLSGAGAGTINMIGDLSLTGATAGAKAISYTLTVAY